MFRIRPGRIGLCVLAAVAVFACHEPRTETYRRVELFSAGKTRIEFTCLSGTCPGKTYEAATPWTLEMDLDTIDDWGAGRIRVFRSDPGPDKLWIWAFDRDSLRMTKYDATQFDTVDIDLWNWHCYRGRP